jgi:hypothetical protein
MNTFQPVDTIYDNQGKDGGINIHEDETSLEWIISYG